MVHLLRGQRLLGRVLDHIAPLFLIGLHQPFGDEGVGVAVLGIKALGVSPAVSGQGLVGGEHQIVVDVLQLPGLVDGAPDVGDVGDVQTAVQGVSYFYDAPLAHAVKQQVRLGVQQQRALHAVGPVVVVGQTAEAGLNAAHHNGLVGIGPADVVAVDGGGVVRPLSDDAAGSKGVRFPALFGHGVVVDHRVHVAAHHQKGQTGFPQGLDAGGVLPVWLGDDAYLIARVLQHPGDDGVTKGGMVHVGVPDNIYKITLLPAPALHILARDGQKISFHDGYLFRLIGSV